MGRKPQHQNLSPVLMSCVIFLVALNLRPAIVAVGPLLSNIGATFGWGESLQGLLGALPLLAFALFSIFVSSITARFSTDRVLFWALIVLAGGCLIRSFFGEGAVWAGTLLIGASIAVGNVLAPAIVKRDFIDHVSFATGAYSACVTSGSAIAGLTASAAAEALGGWQPALSLWALPALAAAALWFLRSRHLAKRNGEADKKPSRSSYEALEPVGRKTSEEPVKRDRQQMTGLASIKSPFQALGKLQSGNQSQKKRASATRPSGKPAESRSFAGNAAKSPLRILLRRPSTWFVTLFMGLQSAAFYTFCYWLPSIAAAAGFTTAEAGVHLFIFQALGIFSGLAIPRFMHVRNSQVCASLLASIPLVVAAAGWLFAPQLSLVWSIFGGIGQGASLVVALTLISLRGGTHAETVALSGLAQSLGYLIAACGPFVFGAITEVTGAFTAALFFMTVLAVAQCLVGVLAGRVPSSAESAQ